MTRPLSNDLHCRVVRAVVDGGMSRRQGGDRRSQRIEARAEAILALIDETPDMTLSEIAAHLEDEHGLRVSQSAV